MSDGGGQQWLQLGGTQEEGIREGLVEERELFIDSVSK